MIEVQKPATEGEADAHETGAAVEASSSLPPLELQPAAARAPASSYQLDELLRYHDRAFVEQVYVALLRRPPTDAERARTLEDLRGGRRSKIEIIEGLLTGADGQATARVVGLPSPTMRRVGRWPVIGYVWRLLRGLVRLPVLMQHQQQFEAYALGQQQRIAEHINDVLAPTLADALDSVVMLSDSLLTLQAQLQADIATLNEVLTAQQHEQQQQQQRYDAGIAAQQELIVQEQHVIVETQKVALEELRAQLRELAATHEQQHAELIEQVRRLQTLFESARAGATARANDQA
ncbi:MAG: hypothetical protein DMF64_10425 [Acidobacteria bacterium]|nr:MAG: hypothetical protein DMF64_10425 [Acidobacteriota bacterium]